MSDIFDLNCTEDLPFKVKKDPSVREMLLDLLAMANRPLSITELRVGLYRKYDKEIDNSQVSTRLAGLVRDGKVIRAAERRFRLVLP